MSWTSSLLVINVFSDILHTYLIDYYKAYLTFALAFPLWLGVPSYPLTLIFDTIIQISK